MKRFSRRLLETTNNEDIAIAARADEKPPPGAQIVGRNGPLLTVLQHHGDVLGAQLGERPLRCPGLALRFSLEVPADQHERGHTGSDLTVDRAL